MGSGKNSCKTAAVMSLLGKGPEQGQAAPAPQVRDIETITGEILAAKRAGGEAVITIGRGLIEAKALLSHGEWLPWLTERVEYSEPEATYSLIMAARDSTASVIWLVMSLFTTEAALLDTTSQSSSIPISVIAVVMIPIRVASFLFSKNRINTPPLDKIGAKPPHPLSRRRFLSPPAEHSNHIIAHHHSDGKG